MNIIKHFNTITKHRFIVMKLCFKCGIYKRGLLHDLSKYSPTEFFEGAKYFCGDGSPIKKCRLKNGYSKAWLHHIGRNKHHPEYWIDYPNFIMMPYEYLVESICDRIAACKVYNKNNYKQSDPLNYWNKTKNSFPANEKVAKFYDIVFTDLANKGENFILNKIYLSNVYKSL